MSLSLDKCIYKEEAEYINMVMALFSDSLVKLLLSCPDVKCYMGVASFPLGKNMSDITCCKSGLLRPASELHPACMPIDIPATDSFYSK